MNIGRHRRRTDGARRRPLAGVAKAATMVAIAAAILTGPAAEGASAIPLPFLVAQPASVDFGTHPPGTVTQRTVTVAVQNLQTFGGSVTVVGAQVGGPGVFAIDSSTCGTLSILFGPSTCELVVSFRPLSPGPSAETLTISYERYNPLLQAVEVLTLDVPLSGVATTSGPTIVGTADPPRNAAGWNNTPVTVSFVCSAGAAPIVSCPGPVTLSSQGAGQSVTGTAVDATGATATTTVGGINIDLTAPTVTFVGNRGTYTIAEDIAISCIAADALSGLASSTCTDIAGPAYSFAVGTTSLSAAATDLAGNVTVSTATVTVAVTYRSLAVLTARFVDDRAPVRGMVAHLGAAEASFDRGNARAASAGIAAYQHHVEAQAGKALSVEEAAILLQLSEAL